MSAVSGVSSSTASIDLVALLAAQNPALAQIREKVAAQLDEQTAALQQSLVEMASGTLDVMA